MVLAPNAERHLHYMTAYCRPPSLGMQGGKGTREKREKRKQAPRLHAGCTMQEASRCQPTDKQSAADAQICCLKPCRVKPPTVHGHETEVMLLELDENCVTAADLADGDNT